jgi:MFS transporter, Spinster family, sphingosine-1-phosphate transporter
MNVMARLPSPRAALSILTGLNFLNYVDRFIPAAILPSILGELGLSDAKGGSLQTLFIMTFVVVSPFAGWLGDRAPRFRLAAVGVMVWSAATFASGLAPTYAFLVLARALIGVGEASYTVVTPSLLSDFYPTNRRGSALAIFYAAIPIGSALGYVLGAQIATHYGWRYAFFVAGAPGAALATVLLFLRDPPRGAQDARELRKLAENEEARKARRERETGSVSTIVSIAGAVRELSWRRSFVYNTAAQTIFTFTVGGLAVWMPTYFIRVRGLSIDTAGTAFGGVLALAGVIGTLIGGRLGDRLGRSRPDAHFLMSGVALIASLPFTLLAILSPTPAIFWPAMFVTLTLLFLTTGPLNAAMANVLPAALRGRGFAFNTMAIHLLGDALSPWLIGVASDRVGLRMPVLATGALMLIAGIVLLAGRGALTRDLRAAA